MKSRITGVLILRHTGVRRQPRHPVPRDLRQEREQRRASLLDDGTPDQGAHGQHDRQQQADRTSGPGTERDVRQRRGMLLNWAAKRSRGAWSARIGRSWLGRRLFI